MVLSDAKAFIEILQLAGGWLQQALGRARRERDRRAAQLLHDVFVLVAAMRAYDNSFRPLLGQLMGFSASWDEERRQSIYDQLVGFLDREQILPHFRQAFASLPRPQWDGAGASALARLQQKASVFEHRIPDGYSTRTKTTF